MRRSTKAVLLACALAAAAAGAAGAAHGKLVASSVSLVYHPSDYGDAMSGSVGSANPKCRAGRALTLFRVAAGHKQAYERAAPARGGHSRLSPKGQVFQTGSYYVSAARKRIGTGRVCRASASLPVQVTPPPPEP